VIRKLVSLYRISDHSNRWYISFGYYKRDQFGRLEWNGVSETAELTEEELYQAVRPKLELQRHK